MTGTLPSCLLRRAFVAVVLRVLGGRQPLVDFIQALLRNVAKEGISRSGCIFVVIFLKVPLVIVIVIVIVIVVFVVAVLAVLLLV
eukprot:scaffold753_cov124-Pinguiococcus_pyrenoidosus.AAC.1